MQYSNASLNGTNEYLNGVDDDTSESKGPLKDRHGDPYANEEPNSILKLKPSNIKTNVILDKDLRNYEIEEKVGDNFYYRPPSSMSFQEYAEYQQRIMMFNYWKNNATGKSDDADDDNSIAPPLFVKKNSKGQEIVSVRPSGNVTMNFGGRWQRVENPAVSLQQQKVGGFEFDQQIAMNVVGTIGDRLRLTANWNTQAVFDFNNSIKIDFIGKEEDLVRSIEAGNVSLPIRNTLVRGAQNLFGVKADLRFGKLDVTAIASNQRGSTQTLTIKGGGQQQSIEVPASDYDDYRHFFLAHYFRDNFDQAYASNPNFPSNGVIINRVEVYVTNRNNTVNNLRNFVSINNLGEEDNTTSNDPVNNGTLYESIINATDFRDSDNTINSLEGINLVSGNDFEVVRSARKLTEGTDFVINKNLGYISLSSRIGEDEAIAVAFEYSYKGTVYKVGELSEDYANLEQDDVIVLKMLKPQSVNIRPFDTWDLMMKNIYQISTGSFKSDNFQVKVIYRDDASGLDNPVLQNVTTTQGEGVNLIKLLNADKFNSNNDLVSDGNWDYLPDITVKEKRGYIIFPNVEPFGDHLRSILPSVEDQNTYVFDTLYASTKNDAQIDASKNKFFIVGKVQTSSSGSIYLSGFNIDPSTVSVVVGGIRLTQGTDYSFRNGNVNITNQGILDSGKDIVITYETADLFNFRQKSLVGARFDYHVRDNFDVGATVLHLSERPLVSRVNIGQEPVKNTQIGLDLHYQDESRLITKIVDKLPYLSTKKPSNVKIDWEGAVFKPGNSKFIGDNGDAYIDDFEGAESRNNLGSSPTRWKIGSTPISDVIDSAATGLEVGYHRAKLSWYNIDRSFYFDGSSSLDLSDDDADNYYTGSYNIDDLFTGTDLGNLQNSILNTFNLAFYPTERGPYNYNPITNTEIDATTGDFVESTVTDNWAAITRAITFNTDFDNANVEFIEFWLLDPFIEENGYGLGNAPTSGNLIFHLGSVSEDVLQDSKHSFENGLINGNTEETIWGNVTTQQYLNNAFDNSVDRSLQDIGLDGLNDADERDRFEEHLLNGGGGTLPEKLSGDPSSDNFVHYNDSEVSSEGLLNKYRNYGGVENNSSIETNNNSPLSSSNFPDNEDLNADNTLGTVDQYFGYKIHLHPDSLNLENKYIVDVEDVRLSSGNNNTEQRWYQFRIPIKSPTDTVNGLNSFKSIKYIRTVLDGFDKTVVLRMADFELVSAQWREYETSLTIDTLEESEKPTFNYSTVNANENAGNENGNNVSPYVSPLPQDVDNSSNQSLTINEQSLSMSVNNLIDGDGKGIYKNLAVDLLNYERVKMFIHAETSGDPASADEVNAIIRLGTDFENNYYEIEIPLTYTQNPNSNSVDEVWPSSNELDISIKDLVNAKLKFLSDPNLEHVDIGRYMVRVVGRPDISNVRLIMLGVKNPIGGNSIITDETRLWFNELRSSGFIKKAGYATNLAIAMNLADLGTLNASASAKTRGYGDIEQKISDRAREDTYNYGFATNLQLDKILPKKLGLKIPIYASYDKKIIKPQYDPLNPDVELDDAIEFMENDDTDTTNKAKRFKEKTIYEETSRSINISNFKKIKTKEDAKRRIYDIENITLSAGLRETKAGGLGSSELAAGNGIDEYRSLNYTGAVKYNFSPKEKSIAPFAKIKQFDKLKLIKDINLNLIPSSITVSSNFDRTFTETHYLNDTLGRDSASSIYQKSFNLYRTYGTNLNLTKSIKTTYNAKAFAVIDDNNLENATSKNSFENNPTRKKSLDEIFKTTGRLKQYDHSLNTSYKLPLNKIRMIDWVTSNITYNTKYNWKSAPVGLDTLGHTISNQRSIELKNQLKLSTLYNKSKFLKLISSPYKKPSGRGRDTVKTKKHMFARIFVRPLLSIRNVSANYSWNYGSAVAGFTSRPHYMGLDTDNNYAPGIKYVTGINQLEDFRKEASDNDWLTQRESLNQQSTEQITRKITGTASIEPYNNLTINLTLSYSRSSNFSAVLRDTLDENGLSDGQLDYISPSIGGNISMTYISIKTAGEGTFFGSKEDNSSKAFEDFKNNIPTFLALYQEENPDIPYDNRSQDVLISSFLAAYTGDRKITKEDNRTFPKFPLPNWKLTYSGLNKIPFLKDKFRSIILTHNYSSIYDLGNYSSSLTFTELGPGQDLTNLDEIDITRGEASLLDLTYHPAFLIGDVSISEKFNPLIGINIKTKKKLDLNIRYSTVRNISLQTTNAQINELKEQSFDVTVGYKKSGLKLPFGFKRGKNITLKNEVAFNLTTKVKDTRTIQRSLDSEDGNTKGLSTVTSGTLNFQLNPNITYRVNNRLNLRIYFERRINAPKISSSFRTANTAFGFELRFSLI